VGKGSRVRLAIERFAILLGLEIDGHEPDYSASKFGTFNAGARDRFSPISSVLLLELLLGCEYAGMEFEGFSQVGEKVRETVVARI
jgi:hypothetical protein